MTKCDKENDICSTCKEAHKHAITLYSLVDAKVDKKDVRMHKALEEHSGSIQLSLDEGKLRFNKIEDKAEKETLTIRELLNKGLADLKDIHIAKVKTWTEDAFKDLASASKIQRTNDIRTLLSVIVPIGILSLTSLITAVVIFTFLRADVMNLQKDMDKLIKEGSECIKIHAELKGKKVID